MNRPSPAHKAPSPQNIKAHEHERPTARPAPDLDYLHERLYRTASGVAASEYPLFMRLDNARLMLSVLRPSDFPREFQDVFTAIMERPVPSADTTRLVLRDIVELFLAISERVNSFAALGDQYERSAWVVREAMEGRREPFVSLFTRLTDRNQPIPPRMRAYIARGQPTRQGGRPSLHPARVRAIAWLVRDRLKFQQQEHPSARRDTSLNKICKDLAPLMDPSWQTIKKAYSQHVDSFLS